MLRINVKYCDFMTWGFEYVGNRDAVQHNGKCK